MPSEIVKQSLSDYQFNLLVASEGIKEENKQMEKAQKSAKNNQNMRMPKARRR